MMKTKIKIKWSDYLMELLIVIIGISIAFWLEDVAVKGKENKERIAYLAAIKTDLKTDSIRLSQNIRNNRLKSEKLIKGLDLIKTSAPLDSVMQYVLEVGNYDFFDPDNFTLNSLLQSGDFKLLESDSIKVELLRLLKVYKSIDEMQKNFLSALDNNYFPMLLNKVDFVEFSPMDSTFFYGVQIKNYCAFTLNETNQHIRNYQLAQAQGEKVIKMIKKEL